MTSATILRQSEHIGVDGIEIGRSREGRPIVAFRFGRGKRHISLIAGCHADEPTGPKLLRRWVNALAALPTDDSSLTDNTWWLVPHANPDGEAVNRVWYDSADDHYDIVDYLCHAQRELPGSDIEFGFPRASDDSGARPENRALADWWRDTRFELHISFHGMAIAAGPWFLIEPAWVDRTASLRRALEAKCKAMGFALHDVDRRGDKGFVRIAPGFSTRPNWHAMQQHFVDLGDPKTAELFRPSSMDYHRWQGHDTLTLVSELPLFITPPISKEGDVHDARNARATLADTQQRWREWRATAIMAMAAPDRKARLQSLRDAIAQHGCRPMPIRDQMTLQIELAVAGWKLLAPKH